MKEEELHFRLGFIESGLCHGSSSSSPFDIIGLAMPHHFPLPLSLFFFCALPSSSSFPLSPVTRASCLQGLKRPNKKKGERGGRKNEEGPFCKRRRRRRRRKALFSRLMKLSSPPLLPRKKSSPLLYAIVIIVVVVSKGPTSSLSCYRLFFSFRS